MKKYIYSALIALTTLSACKKDDFSGPKRDVTFNFENVVSGSPLVFGTTYKNAIGEDYTVSKLNYYISNIELINHDGVAFKVENSYHLIKHEEASTLSFTEAIPTGEYHKISFLIGVDEASNTTGAQEGDLDPSKGMFWSWNSGYIFTMFEGTSPASSTGNFMYHVGGFKEGQNAIVKVTLDFPEHLEIKKKSDPIINLTTDLTKYFDGTNKISFAETNTIHMPGTKAVNVSANYADMISVSSVK